MEDDIHLGHRDRLRLRFDSHGLDNFSDIEALELLLFYAIPRRDTNPIAHALLDSFGSFRAVMDARAGDIAAVPGVGENAASLIALVADIGRRYALADRSDGAFIRSSDEAGDFLLPLFSHLREERTYVVCLDSRLTVIDCRALADGTANRVQFAARDIVDVALRCRASCVVLAHNHMSDTALPSKQDINATKLIYATLRAVGVQLFDHIIVCGDDFVSFRDSGMLSDC